VSAWEGQKGVGRAQVCVCVCVCARVCARQGCRRMCLIVYALLCVSVGMSFSRLGQIRISIIIGITRYGIYAVKYRGGGVFAFRNVSVSK